MAYERLKQNEGSGSGGAVMDYLKVIPNRPQIALARSVCRILHEYGVTIPDYGPMSVEDCKNLPLEVLAVLCASGLLDRPAPDNVIPPTVRTSSPYGRTPRTVSA